MKLKVDEILNKNIWKNFTSNFHLKKKTLNIKENEEYDKIKKLSEQRIK